MIIVSKIILSMCTCQLYVPNISIDRDRRDESLIVLDHDQDSTPRAVSRKDQLPNIRKLCIHNHKIPLQTFCSVKHRLGEYSCFFFSSIEFSYLSLVRDSISSDRVRSERLDCSSTTLSCKSLTTYVLQPKTEPFV